MDERHRWESRYLQAREPFYGREPSRFLQRALPLLPPGGECLDLGGGEGRNAVFLAARGFVVTLADVAVAGLARAAAESRRAAVGLRLVAADLRQSPLLAAEARWDLLLLVNYHDRAAVAAAHHALRPGGAVVVEGFAKEQLGRGTGGPSCADVLWGTNELLGLLFPLRVVLYEDRLVEGDVTPRHRGARWVVRAIAKRVS